MWKFPNITTYCYSYPKDQSLWNYVRIWNKVWGRFKRNFYLMNSLQRISFIARSWFEYIKKQSIILLWGEYLLEQVKQRELCQDAEVILMWEPMRLCALASSQVCPDLDCTQMKKTFQEVTLIVHLHISVERSCGSPHDIWDNSVSAVTCTAHPTSEEVRGKALLSDTSGLRVLYSCWLKNNSQKLQSSPPTRPMALHRLPPPQHHLHLESSELNPKSTRINYHRRFWPDADYWALTLKNHTMSQENTSDLILKLLW